MGPANMPDATVTPAIEFCHVSVSFDELRVLRDVSFVLRPNEMLFVTGASGAGKSVLLHLAAGLFPPDRGRIFIQGREISALGEREKLAIRGDRLGLVFQDEALFTGLNVYDNAAFRLVERKCPEDKVDAAVREILGFVGLEQEIEREISELSGGMKRRLELARAIIGWPPIMLFDEPTTGLDPINSRQVRDIIIRAREFHQMSSLFVTKVMDEIEYLATRRARKTEAGDIVIVKADARQLPQTRVLVLDQGDVVFLGGHEDFSNSRLPAVMRLVHPRSGATNPNYYTADPWSKKRGSAHE